MLVAEPLDGSPCVVRGCDQASVVAFVEASEKYRYPARPSRGWVQPPLPKQMQHDELLHQVGLLSHQGKAHVAKKVC